MLPGKNEHLDRTTLPIEQLVPNEYNPNVMTDREFDLLYDNIEQVGFTDPILVWPDPAAPGKYKVIGGHHRLEVAKLLGYTEVPVTINVDPAFDADKADFQMMRHNMIRGRLSPQKFVALYERMNQKYGREILVESFGFANEDELAKLIDQTANSLPPEMKVKLKEAASEIKTIDDLALVLNRLFTTYGNTLPYSYMVVDFGGKESVWLRMPHSMKKTFLKVADDVCRSRQVPMDYVVDAALQLIANGLMDKDAFDAALNSMPKVEFPATPLAQIDGK
jgi:ParB-like nuclease domain